MFERYVEILVWTGYYVEISVWERININRKIGGSKIACGRWMGNFRLAKLCNSWNSYSYISVFFILTAFLPYQQQARNLSVDFLEKMVAHGDTRIGQLTTKLAVVEKVRIVL